MDGVQGPAGRLRLRRGYARLERLVAPLEDRFGSSPLARLKLGVTFGQATESLDAINAAALSEDDDDPRIVDIGTASPRRHE